MQSGRVMGAPWPNITFSEAGRVDGWIIVLILGFIVPNSHCIIDFQQLTSKSREFIVLIRTK